MGETGIYRPVRGAFLPLNCSSSFLRVVDQGVQGIVELRQRGPHLQHILDGDGYSVILQSIPECESQIKISFGRAVDLVEFGPTS